MKYQIEIDGTEVNLIAKALGSLPFTEVAPLIQKLAAQVKEQEDAAKKAAEPVAEAA